MKKYVVATVNEIPPGQRKIVTVAGRSIGIFNVDGTYYAIRNRCPHAGAPLCEGVLSGFVTSNEPGDYTYSRRGEILRCPWHQWEFDVTTGQSWYEPAKVRVKSYPVKVEQGCTLSTTKQATKASENGMEHLEKGPFVAETFPVSSDDEYIVIEM
ncbi:MAG: Rieske (2Fe-2S) protein [Bacillota bacterium]